MNDSKDCPCSYYECGSDPGDEVTRCLNSNHLQNLNCSVDHCRHMRLSTSHAFASVPPEVALGLFPDDVKRDLCLTEGLAESFRKLRDYPEGFAPWTYFGATDTGVFASWPGQLREPTEDNTCSPYDPRLRPWWRFSAWKNRNVVILIDMSRTMNDMILSKEIRKYDLASNMTSKLLDTLSEEDTVQIILFEDTPRTLLGSNLMLTADERTVKRLRSRLFRERPGWTGNVDIGKALEMAFKLLEDIDSTNQKCENHIVLFTESRDCTSSSMRDCNAKIYGGVETAEFVTDGIALTLDYAKHLQNHLEEGLAPPTLFTYSLAPDANAMTSQLACHLGGIHVDLERELSVNANLDPLHLMRGYLHKAALPIKSSLGNDRMTISELYMDGGGLGRMNTLVMPVFFQPREDCPAIHYGVIGADMPVSIYEESGVDWDSPSFSLFVSNWNEDLSCRSEEIDRCTMQVLRGPDAQCVYPLDNREGPRCYRFGDHYYLVNDTEPGFTLRAAENFCTDNNGQLIAPREIEERRFLATLVPPDGAWINLTWRGSRMTWPDGMVVDHDQQIRIEMTCNNAWSRGFYMDPRSFDDNIQCSQNLQRRPAICRFPLDNPPDACDPIEDVREITEDDFVQTIKTCGMEECLLNNVPSDAYSNMPGDSIICNNELSSRLDWNSAVCCTEDELNELCVASALGIEEDEKRLQVPRLVILVGGVVGGVFIVFLSTAVLCIFWIRHRKSGFSGQKHKHTRIPMTSTSMSERHQLEILRKGKAFDSIRSPFETSGSCSPSVGKRPELVVNIEVEILDNGWEKVGGYGRVRQGEYTDPVGQVHKVAVKFVDVLAPDAAWEALKNEFDILASIPVHPNIVKPIGAHWGDRSENSSRYIVEELMHTNLGDLMNGSPPPYPDKIMLYRDWIRIFIDIATGLEHLHKHKIIHFDLKPRNVLLDEHMNAKIADFGCSKSKFDTYIELSRMGGTPPYLAPECWMLYYAQNCRTEVARVKIDVYSLGVIMWECLSGGSTLQSSLYKRAVAHSRSTSSVHPDHIEIRKDSRSSEGLQGWEIQYHLRDEIPEALRRLVTACVKVDFDARPTCEEILQTLRPMLNAQWVNQPVSMA